MGNLRVYEAARKLNMQAGELVKILEGKGIHASPIATISEEVFNELLEELVGGAESSEGEPSSPLKLVSLKDKAEPLSELDEEQPEGENSDEEPARPMLSLAPEMTETETDLAETIPGMDETQPTISDPQPMDETTESETAEATKEEPGEEAEPAVEEPKDEPVESTTTEAPQPAEAPEPVMAPVTVVAAEQPSKSRPSLVSYASFILALMALAAVAYVNNNVSQQGRQLGDAMASIQATNERVDGVDQANELQGQMIAANRAETANLADTVAAQARLDAKNEISANASALEEMAPALPPAQAQRIKDLSRRLAELGSSL
ncbi:MAG: translation initiation factor IF-2 N-terminal domain-containing protein [Nitrospinota bacterium]|nr:translation initiation factor IF-2 N-terminal domain-containing protein [Nitrospinota bacterium]